EGDLAGHEQQSAGDHALRIRPDGLGGFRTGDVLLGHEGEPIGNPPGAQDLDAHERRASDGAYLATVWRSTSMTALTLRMDLTTFSRCLRSWMRSVRSIMAVWSAKVRASAVRMSVFIEAPTAVMAASRPGRSSTSTAMRTS